MGGTEVAIRFSMILRQLHDDLTTLAVEAHGDRSHVSIRRTLLRNDSFRILLLHRLRGVAIRRRLRLANHLLRCAQTALFGVEIGNEVTLGTGVYFVHSVGIVIGGDAVIGDRVRFLGGNTVGTAKDNGYPIVEERAVIGAGARIIGPVLVGAGAVIGANAVVCHDVPPGATATGVPARVRENSRPQFRSNTLRS